MEYHSTTMPTNTIYIILITYIHIYTNLFYLLFKNKKLHKTSVANGIRRCCVSDEEWINYEYLYPWETLPPVSLSDCEELFWIENADRTTAWSCRLQLLQTVRLWRPFTYRTHNIIISCNFVNWSMNESIITEISSIEKNLDRY